MAQDPVNLLIELNMVTQMLDNTQVRIDSARTMFPSDQMWQLELDRKQSEVDTRRRFVEVLKLDISRRN